MKEFFEFVSNDNAAFVAGIVLALVGLLAPKKFLGIEMDWRPATSGTAVVLGVIFLVFSFPQMRFWHSKAVSIDKTALATIVAKVTAGRDAAQSAHDNVNDHATCLTRGGQASQVLSEALGLLVTLQQPKTATK